MQGALDSASLMVAKNLSDGKITTNQIPTAGPAYFAALYTETDVQSVQAAATYTANSGGKGSTVAMTASGAIKSQFMQIAGFPTLGFGVSSTSTWGSNLLRIALVLGQYRFDERHQALEPEDRVQEPRRQARGARQDPRRRHVLRRALRERRKRRYR
ncbi:hypothetical protein ACVWW4_007020 [Bradyrhizobium sp. LB7.1]